jgi:hypothetical protein
MANHDSDLDIPCKVCGMRLLPIITFGECDHSCCTYCVGLNENDDCPSCNPGPLVAAGHRFQPDLVQFDGEGDLRMVPHPIAPHPNHGTEAEMEDVD